MIVGVHSLTPENGHQYTYYDLYLGGRGQLGSLLTSGPTVELTVEHPLGLGHGGSIRRGCKD